MSRKTDAVVARTIGIDTGKNMLHLIGLDDNGAIVLREKVSRGRIAARLTNVPQCLIGIEAGMATHYVARELIALGHDVKQVPTAYARPFRQGHKNDFRDAHAIAEAVQRPSTRCVPVKTNDQLDLQALHRVRSRLISDRTAVINQIRSFLLEHGIAVRQGLRFLRQQLPELLAKRIDVLSPRMIRIIEDLSGDWRHLDGRIEQVTEEIEGLARGTEGCRQLMTVPGVGPIIASAMIAAIGNGAAFAKGRDFAAWLGLVPKQMSTGDRTILGRISKSGNRYLRMLFMQGARVILLRPENWQKHSCGAWLTAAAKRLHHNVLATALANKLARITWTVLAQGRSYEARVEPRTAEGSGCNLRAGPSHTQAKQKDTCRGLRVELRRWRNGLAVASVIWWHYWPFRAFLRIRSDARGYPRWPAAQTLRSRAGYRSARPIPSRSSHSACNARPEHRAAAMLFLISG